MKNRLLVASCLSLLLSAPCVQATPPVFTLQAGVGVEDFDGEEDTFFNVTANALFSEGLSRKSMLNFIAEVSSYHYRKDKNDENSAEKLFLEGKYSYTPRAGFSVPTYSIALRQLEEYKKDSDSDASTTSLVLSIGYRIDDQTNVLGGLRFSEKSSMEDSSESAVFVNLDYLLSEKWMLYTTLIVADEEIDSEGGGGMGGRPAAGRLAAMGHTTSGPPSPAGSTIDYDNTWLTIGAGYVIDGQNSLDAAVSARTYESSDNEIDSNVITLDYFYRF